MNKKIVLVILVLIVLSGCVSKENQRRTFCESIGYSDWNWYNRLTGDYSFFCYTIDCDNNITTSKLFLDIGGAKAYKACNYKPVGNCKGD